MKKSDNAIVLKRFDFSVRIVKCYKHLIRKDKDLRLLYDHLLRSGTSIGANVAESQAAGSKMDFRYKLRISLKESYETEFWLQLFFVTEHISEKQNLIALTMIV